MELALSEGIVDYKIIKNCSIYNLEKEVLSYIESGWQPIGGICIYISASTATTYFVQAIIKMGVKNE